jgi:hypothetical protein
MQISQNERIANGQRGFIKNRLRFYRTFMIAVSQVHTTFLTQDPSDVPKKGLMSPYRSN